VSSLTAKCYQDPEPRFVRFRSKRILSERFIRCSAAEVARYSRRLSEFACCPGRMYVYPDLSAVCDPPVLADDHQDILVNPAGLFDDAFTRDRDL